MRDAALIVPRRKYGQVEMSGNGSSSQRRCLRTLELTSGVRKAAGLLVGRSDEKRALLGRYAANTSNLLPTFREDQPVPPSRVKDPNLAAQYPSRVQFSSTSRQKSEITHGRSDV
jgi:hypothetical protein